MRTEQIRESADTELVLTEAEAERLAVLGGRLASRSGWWGDPSPADSDGQDRTVIRVRQVGVDRWRVRVSDAVGVIAIPGVQLIVMPKIPMPHLLYLFARSGQYPRLEEQATLLRTDDSLLELVATWFVGAAERVLRLGLIRDYQLMEDELGAVRGRVDALETGALYYSGRLTLSCEFEEFGFDGPLNRMLRGACIQLASNPLLRATTRRRALKLIARLEDIGEFHPGDLQAEVTRQTLHYMDAVALARSILRNMGRTLILGSQVAWTFLIRTPEMVEAGIRSVLQEHLPSAAVRKEGRKLEQSSLTLNPDLVFGRTRAVADVKYKLADAEWQRTDLYQVVTFAVGYGVQAVAVVNFREPGVSACRPLLIGDVHIHECSWPADQLVPPAHAAALLAVSIEQWLEQRTPHDVRGLVARPSF